MLPAGLEPWGSPVAVDQAFVARAFPVFVYAAQVAGLHSERFLEAVLEKAAPVPGCHRLRNKGLCCRRGLCIQTPWVPIFRQTLLVRQIIQRRRYSKWRKRHLQI